jgi:hypothetical protein
MVNAHIALGKLIKGQTVIIEPVFMTNLIAVNHKWKTTLGRRQKSPGSTHSTFLEIVNPFISKGLCAEIFALLEF